MLNKILIIFFLMTGVAHAGDYVCFDVEGKITRRYVSIDGYIQGIATSKDCIKVTREQINSINKYSVVRDGKMTELTELEKAALDQAEADAKTQAELEASKVMTVEKLVAVLEDKAVLTKTEVETKEIIDVQETTK